MREERRREAESPRPRPRRRRRFGAARASKARRSCRLGSSMRIWRPPTPSVDLVAERRAGTAQALDLGGEVGDLELEAVPAARLRQAAVGHRPRRRRTAAGRAQQAARRSPRSSIASAAAPGASRPRPEQLAVAGDRRVAVVDEVAHADRATPRTLPSAPHVRPATIDDYIAGLPPTLREAADQTRAVIDRHLAGATSAVLWGHPTWSVDDDPVCYLRATAGELLSASGTRGRSTTPPAG